LKALLERPGELVTREELRQRLWADDTFVDFEQGLNGIMRRLREALGDSADAPTFIETLPRRGYGSLASSSPRNPRRCLDRRIRRPLTRGPDASMSER
jgi:DNA-binding winged helix-turn-helix (wHTH) protein